MTVVFGIDFASTQPDSQPDSLSLGTIVVFDPLLHRYRARQGRRRRIEDHHEPVACALHFGTAGFGHRLAQNGEVAPSERVEKTGRKT
jgi:hypothetical protein